MNRKTNQRTEIDEQTKPNKNKHVHIENVVVVIRGEGREGEMGKGDQLYGDRSMELNFWC